MSLFDIDDRPPKKRRFFVEDDSPPLTPDVAGKSPSPVHREVNSTKENEAEGGGFDKNVLEAVLGIALDDVVVRQLESASEGNVERAINIYLDGSYKRDFDSSLHGAGNPSVANDGNHDITSQSTSTSLTSASGSKNTDLRGSLLVENIESVSKEGSQSIKRLAVRRGSSFSPQSSMPERRYIGAFGAACWATRSGAGLVNSGEQVKIERTKTFGKGRGNAKFKGLGRQDIIVRFTNLRNEEVGRLETDSAAWVSTLIDQQVCDFEGFCVYAPERVRSNDSIYLQLKCYLLRPAFLAKNFVKPLDPNRHTGIFEVKETQGERDLHLRQVALVKLFHEINLKPSQSSAATAKHRREALIQAADAADQKEPSKSSPNDGTSTPPDDAEDGEELEQDQLDTLYSKAQSFDFNTPEFEPPKSFAMNLRKYQKQALHWMHGKETDQKSKHKDESMHPLWEEYLWPIKDVDGNALPDVQDVDKFYVNPFSGELSLDFPVQEQNCLGGILADEMGLGKTIEMMSLIHSHKSEVAMQLSSGGSATILDLPRLPKTSTDIVYAPCTTLVVAPMSLLAQWESEAYRASHDGTMKVLLYYGAEKGGLNLQTLCCEANAASAPTVIITSYGSLLSEFTRLQEGGASKGSTGGLFSLDYFRVILDEAHHIKNRQSKTAKACYEIAATHRWVLTGTPIVNRLEDLFSLVHFLRVEPWSNFSFWKTFITTPFESKEYVKALDVVQTVLEPLVLRRTKDMKTPEGEALVPLPTRTIEIESLELSENEREVYNLIYARAKRTFNSNVEAGTLMKSYTTIFAQILRLRQSCCHPVLTRNKDMVTDEEDAAAAADIAAGLADDMDLQALITRFTAETEGEQDANKFGAHALQQIQDEAEAECPICSEEPMIDQAVTGCWHSACKNCLIAYINHAKDKNEIPRCFNCREPINARDIFGVVRHERCNDDDEDSQMPRVSLRRLNQPSSAKIQALLSHLSSLKRTSPEAKSVVFSQFTSFLDLIEPSLIRARIPFLRFDGSINQKTRAAILEKFCKPATNKKDVGMVLLLSLRAGGVGLNLTAASHVFMMDPWWSWAVEAQAIDRVHRMGQEKEVKVVRFVCSESIEEKMLKVQERKRFIASSLGMMSEEEKRLQRVEDIRELLS